MGSKTSLAVSEALIAALRSPAAYSHASDDLCVHETHISWVVLSGCYAYKIKKPVDFGFLDFTTLERRKHYCGEELRLNRRLAPDLYLDVVPIAGTCDAPQVNGSGPPIEYAVRMRRFPQEALLSQVLEQNTLTPQHIDDLATVVAEFHLGIPHAASSSSFGAPEQI